MGAYVADYTEIEPRIGREIKAASAQPTQADVDAWILLAEQRLAGILAAAGISTSFSSGTRGFQVFQDSVADYIAGRVRQAHAAAAGDGGNDDGQDQIARWEAFTMWILDNEKKAALYFGDSPASHVASHVTDTELNLSASDYEAKFTIKGNHL